MKRKPLFQVGRALFSVGGDAGLGLRKLFFLVVFMGYFISGCGGTLQEIVTCDPPQADIYWGETPSMLRKTGKKTPQSRSFSGSELEKRCYQVKKAGYHDSDVICRGEEKYRYLEFRLEPIKTTITSDPPGAVIYWGPSKDQLKETIHKTPRTVYEAENGASWKDWYYQVKKQGYLDSDIVFLPQQPGDREVHFELKQPAAHVKRETKVRKESVKEETTGRETTKKEIVKKAGAMNGMVEEKSPQGQTVSGTKVTLTWEDQSDNESGFEIERKTGPKGVYAQIATVGQNVTSYTDTGLQPGMTYFYRIRAYNAHGHSAYSGEIRVEVKAN